VNCHEAISPPSRNALETIDQQYRLHLFGEVDMTGIRSFEALTLDGAPLSTAAEMTHGKVCMDHHLG